MSSVPEPRLDRQITLQFMGDGGQANLHRICGWMSHQLGERSGAGSRFGIWNGLGGTDSFDALIDRDVDVAFFVPAWFAPTVAEGKGIYGREGFSDLRALAVLPQDDRLVIALHADLGLETLADIREKKPALRLATAVDDGMNMVGYATHRLLEAAGIPRTDIESWGGTFIEGSWPWDTIPRAGDGTANGVIFEAIMTPLWRDLTVTQPLNFIPIDDDVLSALEADYGWRRGTVSAGRFAGQAKPFEALDFSDFLMMCHADMDDDVAYLMAWCLCETREAIERQYRHLAPENSPLSYPLQPAKMAQAPMTLHDGARRYYEDAGLL